MNLLIVDDTPINQKLLRAQLESEGHAVFEAHDGVDALALLEQQRVDVVISDILMPRMDGYRLCHEIRKHTRLHDLPIIIYSSTYTAPEDEKLALEMGANKYLKKPASVATIAAALHQVIAQPHSVPRPDVRREVEVLKNYNERLVSKLNEKNTELQAAEVKFHALVEQSIVGIYIIQDDQFVYVNPEMQKIFGWSEAEMTSRTLSDFVVAEDQALVRENIRRRISGGVPGVHYSLRMFHQSGAVLQVEVHGSWTDYNGRPAVMGTLLNITERKRTEESLRLQSAALNAAADAIVITDRAGVMEWVNPAFTQLTGYTAEEALGTKLGDLVKSGKHAPAFYKEFWETILAGRTWHGEIINCRKDGRLYTEDQVVTPILDASGAITHFVAIRRDITERKAAERMIAHLNRVYAMLSGINTLIVRVRDRDELFREACRIAVEAGGFRMALIAIVDRSAMKIVPVASAGKDEELLRVVKGLLSSSESAPTTMSARALREKKAVVSNDWESDPQVLLNKKYAKSGVRSMAVLPLIVSDEAVGVLALYASESEFFREEEMKLLTELAGDVAFVIDHLDKRERLDYLAYYDELTGLANRTLFLERVAQYKRSAVSGGHQLALFLIDLERFKSINDSLGRPAGDELLKQVAQWLTHNTAQDVNLLARVGADHFALVMPVVKQGGNLMRLLEKWIEAFLNHPFRLNDAVFRIAVKVGGALFPDDGADAETLFRNAEAALKKAKASGERYLFYTQKMTSLVAGKLTLENQLRQAINKGEFVLYYQPKVNLASGKMTSAEALIRWNDPHTGLVPPGRFIPILEETGMIYEVGRWALHQAIKDYLRWRAAGLSAVRIAVNVSPLQLRNRGFIAEIEQAIGIDAQAAAGLELEITESLIMEDVNGNIASLQAIRDLGVTIAIDDFGTGFSSLRYLAKLPVDTLKIDRSFVIDMTGEPQGLALVSTIISLAHALDLKVVAEGVETEEQARLLRLLRCDEMQGYLFSQPVPGDIFETRLLASPPGG